MLVLFCFAATCIIYGSVRSYSFHNSGSGTTNKELSEAVSTFKLRNIIIFVIIACVTLLLFFYFFNIVYYLLLILVIIVSFFSMFFVLAPFVDYVFARFKWESKAINIPKLPAIHYSLITLVLMCLSVLMLWIFTGNWLVINCMAWCIGVTQLAVIRLPNLKLSIILLCAFLVYDVFWVFISPVIFGQSVMVAVATKMPTSALPMTLSVPHVLDNGGYSLLGLGDIVLPGLFICYTYSFDTAVKESIIPRSINDEIIEPPKVGYFVIAFIGYIVGFVSTLLAFVIMEVGQPALLYLVPCCVIPVCVAANMQGHLQIMWKGTALAPPREPEDQALIPMGDEESQQQQQHEQQYEQQTTQQLPDSANIQITADDVAQNGENNNTILNK